MNNIRKTIRATVTMILVVAIIPSALVACKGGIDKNGAKILIEDFLEVLASGNYDVAESYLHPDCLIDLEKVMDCIETEENVDFQDGISVKKDMASSWSYYNSKVDGAQYARTMKLQVGDKQIIFTVEIVQNDNGYGVYALGNYRIYTEY